MLSIEKKIVGRFVFPYSICVYDSERGKRVLCATESEGKCISFDARTGEDAETVWEGPGGTMSIVPDGPDAFYATQAFFKGMRGGGSFLPEAPTRTTRRRRPYRFPRASARPATGSGERAGLWRSSIPRR